MRCSSCKQARKHPRCPIRLTGVYNCRRTTLQFWSCRLRIPYFNLFRPSTRQLVTTNSTCRLCITSGILFLQSSVFLQLHLTSLSLVEVRIALSLLCLEGNCHSKLRCPIRLTGVGNCCRTTVYLEFPTLTHSWPSTRQLVTANSACSLCTSFGVFLFHSRQCFCNCLLLFP